MKKLFFMLSLPAFLIVNTALPSYGDERDCEVIVDGEYIIIEHNTCVENEKRQQICCYNKAVEITSLSR